MGTLQRLKAYFGMVPADEFDDYDDYAAEDDYHPRRHGSGYSHRPDYLGDEDGYEPYRPASRPPAAWAGDPPTHGALAVETRREPVARLRPAPEPVAAAGSSYPLGRIVTLHPTSYNEARTIGEHYRDGTPVIMNLTEMDDADAKRLVDFAAGLAFALRGSIDKVTNKVFLISPPNVDPTAEDKRRIAEGGLFTRA
jgi:cell division inhibitor SepF